MINWYELGDTNQLAEDERTRFLTGQIIEGKTPEIIVSGTVNEHGDSLPAKMLILFGGAQMPVPEIGGKDYTTRDNDYGLRLIETILYLGINNHA